ncbi:MULTISPECIES: transposase [unclassified Clostridium]|uniref:transposase n=1 Tax=unclassified Clostridium TaxID=2614128 RepID=UPI003F93BD6A
MRVLKFELESGITKTLITNIFDESFSVSDFKKLYFKRWGIEVKYNEIKNKLQIENFTGKTVISIEQDFYATIYLSNMVSLAKKDANEAIEEKYKNKSLKYEYKVNTNVLIGKLKDYLIVMLITKNPWKRNKILKYIQQEIQRNVIPIRPDRRFERKEHKDTQMANRMNKKRVL